MIETIYGTFDIKSLKELEDTTSALSKHSAELTNNSARLREIIKLVREDWISTGADAESYVVGLNNCLNTLDYKVLKTLNEYVSTLNTLAAYTKEIKRREMESQEV